MQIVDAGKAIGIIKSNIDTAEDVDLDTKVELELLENVNSHRHVDDNHEDMLDFIGYESPPEGESTPTMMTGQHHDEGHSNRCVL